MTRPLRPRHHEPLKNELDESSRGIKDENGIIHTTTRSLRKVNYADVENNYDFIDEVVDEDDEDEAAAPAGSRRRGHAIKSDSEEFEPAEKTEDEPEPPIEDHTAQEVSGPETRNSKSRGGPDEDGDESFHEEDAEDEDEDALAGSEDEYLSEESIRRSRRRADRNFVVSDEDDEDEDTIGASKRTRRGYRTTTTIDTDEDDPPSRRNFRSSTIQARQGRRSEISPPRKLRRRARSAYGSEERQSRSDRLSLADELRELRDDSPVREKRSLRERTKPVNYTLPPPIGDTAMDETAKLGNANGILPYPSPKARRGLHAGQSFGPLRRLFPTGGPFGGNDVTAIFGTNTNYYDNAGQGTANNKLLLDSDSSEDEILPLGAVSTKPNESTHKKKKPEIADLDPLGVDMNIKFEDVGGLDNYIDQLKEMVALPLLYPELYQKFGITPPRGVLFHGPPGTGKTLMARALAASCSTEQQKITFFMRKGADILSKWVGEAERQLRLLFEEAKKQQPSIIFFDEIDGLAPVRSSKQEQIHASIVSTMLALMDGMDNRGQVIVIGATNRPDAVDPALRRPGRFDREFFFPLPDLSARSKILEIHTKKWDPPLPKPFIDRLASLTKGYGGADLRALCTEAALISIQRKVPQIYQSEMKLSINLASVNVKARDFMMALEKIVPSSARSAGNSAQPIPETVEALLDSQFEEIKKKLKSIIPSDSKFQRNGASTIKHYLEYEVEDSDEESDGFSKAEFLRNMEKARVCKPRLIVTGSRGNGQQYVGAAILHYLEDFNMQMLDVGTLASDSTRSFETAIVQIFTEARRRQPSVLYIPNSEIWLQAVPENAILMLASLLRSLRSDEKVLLLAVANGLSKSDILEGSLSHLEFEKFIHKIRKPSSSQRAKYFLSLKQILKTKPSSFEQGKKRTKPLPQLPVVESSKKSEGLDKNGNPLSEEAKLIQTLKSFQNHDMKLKNTLKLKLSGLMDLFKNRYKRFRKPPIDDALLIHLFETNAALQGNPDYQPAYIKENNMILECATGRRFFNMDLDIVEERLWNGFYSEPRQFLKDIELIYKDAHTSGDRERIIKASEMFVNAQMGIEEISAPDFVMECRDSRQRELTRQKLNLEKQAKLKSQELSEELQVRANEVDISENDLSSSSEKFERNSLNGSHALQVGVGSGGQLQCQAQKNPQEELQVEDATNDEQGNNTERQLPNDDINPLQIGNNEYKKDDAEAAEIEGAIDGKHAESETPRNSSPENSKSSEQSSLSEEALIEEGGPQVAEFILDDNKLNDLLSLLEHRSEGFTVQKLEELYAFALNIIWEDRLLWDRTTTLHKLLTHIENWGN
ncbi:chromatin segregase YTA7 [Lachancea thermotolerans CBS 6340]|uniref:KLTH0B09130p n=1 Tax=Lachancea thermotolerans (strain ATCC 56472 / CBS 6340 / NRRL Y-8284) TaxID=559295 RepID=C5DD84_LACTC|nr:KLTH0B09130p [Lachancea thermotolerans CBS 6340]CAR21745.1 KLTH0B09130p [Lachancea thermotolerans CBS 6340]